MRVKALVAVSSATLRPSRLGTWHMKGPYAHPTSYRRSRTASLLTSCAVKDSERLGDIWTMAWARLSDGWRFRFRAGRLAFWIFSLATKTKRWTPAPVQRSPSRMHLEHDGWAWSHCIPCQYLLRGFTTVETDTLALSPTTFAATASGNTRHGGMT